MDFGPIKKNLEQKRKKVEALDFTARRRAEELLAADKEMAFALEEERTKKEKEIEDGILAQIRYQNDLGDEVWRDMHLDPPYEKHIRAPCWSVALSKAIIENGIAHKDRKALPFVKVVEETDSEHEEEEEWEKKAKALVNGVVHEETTTTEDGKEEEDKTIKPIVFAVPYVPRIKVPGNALRVSRILSKGIGVKDLKEQSEKYRKELRKRNKKRQRAEKKLLKEKARIAAMTPEERLEDQMQKSAKGKKQRGAARAKQKKVKEELKAKEKRERRKRQKNKRK